MIRKFLLFKVKDSDFDAIRQPPATPFLFRAYSVFTSVTQKETSLQFSQIFRDNIMRGTP